MHVKKKEKKIHTIKKSHKASPQHVYKRLNKPNVYKHTRLTKETERAILQDDTDPLTKRSGNSMREFKVDVNTGTFGYCLLVCRDRGRLKVAVITVIETDNSICEMRYSVWLCLLLLMVRRCIVRLYKICLMMSISCS